MSAGQRRPEAFAAAKINLFLHVGPLSADGYHPIASLMVFADVGDRLSLAEPGAAPLSIAGEFAGGLAGEADNLVLRAARALGAPAAFVLDKALPLAAGLGGGSADAAAALRLLNGLSASPRREAALAEIAAGLGSDVPACVAGRPVLASGRGEVLEEAPPLPVLHAVLANPGVASPTGPVYRAFDAEPAGAGADMPAWPTALGGVDEVVEFLGRTRNDLEAPAVKLEPAIGAALALLEAQPQTLFARMSGSGATTFALCADADSAVVLAARLGALRPNWWVRACRLGGPWT